MGTQSEDWVEKPRIGGPLGGVLNDGLVGVEFIRVNPRSRAEVWLIQVLNVGCITWC